MKAFYILMWFLLTIFSSGTVQAQTSYKFTYDASGNRLIRSIVLKNAKIHSDSLQARQEDKLLDDQVGLQKTIIYPNPTKGILHIDFPELKDQQPLIYVYDPNGKIIIQKTASSLGNEINLSSHPEGFYILIIRIGQEEKEWKIIKE